MSDNDFLYSQLVKLGDMMGDGMHLEPGGEWIEKEYRRICMQLGIIKRKNHSPQINEFMSERTEAVKCDCGGKLEQTRSGSFIAACCKCGKKYRLGKRR